MFNQFTHSLLRVFITALLLLVLSPAIYAQKVVTVNDHVDQHIFNFNEIEWLKDTANKLSFEKISGKDYEHRFTKSLKSTPQTTDLKATYWFKIKIKHNSKANKRYLLEFFDQTIDHVTAYLPQKNGTYEIKEFGDQFKFDQREVHHKNFELYINNDNDETQVYYFKFKSSQISDAIIVLRSVDWFISYALDEYFYFGIFYGMILVFSFYNLIMFIAIRQRQYLYYVLYNLSVGFFEMSTDGIAYQYLWSAATAWNQIAYAFALYATSLFALLFTKQLLLVKAKAPRLNQFILYVIGIRTVLFLYSLFFDRSLFTYKFLEFIPLAVAFYTGIYIYKQGYKPARFFVLGYSFLFIGFTLKFLIMLGFEWLNFGVISYYSLSFCFVLEMVFLSFAIGDKVRILKTKKEKVQRQIIRQMAENAKLKDTLNQQLETKVEERTKEVFHKSLIIEAKNAELLAVNDRLQQQAEEISRMNVLLEQDNQELQTNVEKVTRDRVMSADVDFEEFSRIYPDKESCNLFLSELKWKDGYTCRKCKNTHFYTGHIAFSRRCSKCGYEESVTAYTVFQNTRIPINKAFYMIFLIYSSKGKISSHKLAEILNIRQSTCWTYGSKIKILMEERKAVLKKVSKNGWSQLVLE
ncbi:putative nucleic-acid-binding Zn-ribbon protein [Pedobacter cryoconitis]|uniref:Putative nucleic-acid-binding Zn-ribbon protein n=1 Tax=Pedobacter cryoconitis TaxID=188932 RepID=A0A7W9E003_9SPHI|nr:7TM diverse intracellular signaling domain-containing protein [Pedobacter cryoconitis]MBB5636100.1 putative nucleic-acid-binding Zn-ribbon protein [Pedobacter cryoconitis]MBB6272978.1 putative nucleic-acid-binding Zn-ribbon protein [Pedobacter cryoconitis]